MNNSGLSFASVNGVLYNKDKTELICYPEGKKDELLVIPEGVTSVLYTAFDNAENIRVIHIPYSLKDFPKDVFMSCTGLVRFEHAEKTSSIKDVADIVSENSENEAIKAGDIDNDGKLSVIDCITLKGYCLGISDLTDKQLRAADVNGDGSVNIVDLIVLKDIVLNS